MLIEEHSQILQLLLDLNSCPQVPPRLRYDLRPRGAPPSASDGTGPIYDQEEGHLALRKARYQLQSGELTSSAYQKLENSLLDSPAFAPSQSYASLVASVPVSVSSGIEKQDFSGPIPSGFLTAKQEEQYLDSSLNHTASVPRPHVANSLSNANAEQTAEQKREMQLRNPVSVYNWLRKHQPQVFLQDNEANGERPPRSTGSRSSKRAAANRESGVKHEHDLYDDEGFAVEPVGPTARGKRKRDDDGGYRPKGGNSRPSKRKKEEGIGRRGKKLSLDARS